VRKVKRVHSGTTPPPAATNWQHPMHKQVDGNMESASEERARVAAAPVVSKGCISRRCTMAVAAAMECRSSPCRLNMLDRWPRGRVFTRWDAGGLGPICIHSKQHPTHKGTHGHTEVVRVALVHSWGKRSWGLHVNGRVAPAPSA
jgi:hypothetical protein